MSDSLFDNNRKLHLGCGKIILHGWLNTDLHEDKGVQHLDVTKKFPFDDESFGCVFSEHLFEHLSFADGVRMLMECHRVLKKGGIMRLTMPHLEFLIDLYANPDNPVNKRYIRWSMETFDSKVASCFPDKDYPAMFVVNNFMRFWGHKMLYDEETICGLIKAIGFTDIRTCKTGESSHKVLRNIERHGTQIPQWANELESMTIEATKS